jgi:hypothetical protein
MVLECYALVWCCLWHNLVDFACYLDSISCWLCCLLLGFQLVLSQGLSFVQMKICYRFGLQVIMVWLYSFKSGLLMHVCC